MLPCLQAEWDVRCCFAVLLLSGGGCIPSPLKCLAGRRRQGRFFCVCLFFSSKDYNRNVLSVNRGLCKQSYKVNYGVRVNEMAPVLF